MATKEVKQRMVQRIAEKKETVPADMEEIKNLLNDVELLLIKEIEDEQDQNENYYTVRETAERFNVTPQAIHKWMQNNKIDYVVDETPGGKHYKIPKKQFENGENEMQKRMEIMRRIDESIKKVKHTKDEDLEDYFPVSDEEDRMEELDFD